MINLRNERMSDVFDKFHLDGIPGTPVIHRFSDIDRGDPHDHPWGFTSFVLAGGYVEEGFDRRDGSITCQRRYPGNAFFIDANHIHRIIDLPEGECWTIITPGPWVQEPGFWQFREDGAYRRPWNGEWQLMSPSLKSTNA